MPSEEYTYSVYSPKVGCFEEIEVNRLYLARSESIHTLVYRKKVGSVPGDIEFSWLLEKNSI